MVQIQLLIRINIGMSVYNGFVNHDQETKYYQLVKYLVTALQKRLVKFYKQEQCNQMKFVKLLDKIRYKIAKLELRKYSQPKFGSCVDQLLASIQTPFTSQLSSYNIRRSKLQRMQSNLSHFSFDFSLADQSQFAKQNNRKLPSLQRDDHRKKYKSLQKMKNHSIIEEVQSEYDRKFTSKLNQFKNIQSRLRPPKIESFIENVRRQSNDILNSNKKVKVLKEIDSFLGQRRKRTKKNTRNLPFKL